MKFADALDKCWGDSRGLFDFVACYLTIGAALYLMLLNPKERESRRRDQRLTRELFGDR